MFARFSTLRTLAVLTLPFFLVPGASAADDPPPQDSTSKLKAAVKIVNPVFEHLQSFNLKVQEEEIDRLKSDLFSQSISGIDPFVERTLARKSELTVDAAGEGFGVLQDTINAAIGAGTVNADLTRTNRFFDAVRADLRRELRPETASEKIKTSLLRMKSRIESEESKCFVGLGVDTDLPPIRIHFPSSFGNQIDKEIDRFAKTATAIAKKNLVVGMGKLGTSMLIDKLVSERVVDPDANLLTRAISGYAIGTKVDQALDRAVSQSGHNPKAELAREYRSMIQRLEVILEEGADDTSDFDFVYTMSGSHLDEMIRADAKRALDVLEDSCDIGLNRQIKSFRRKIERRFFGTVVKDLTGALNAEPIFDGLDPSNQPPVPKLLDLIRAARRRWEAAK